MSKKCLQYTLYKCEKKTRSGFFPYTCLLSKKSHSSKGIHARKHLIQSSSEIRAIE